MNLRPTTLAAILTVTALTAGARAEEARTVSGLLAEGYTVASTFMTQIGPAIFLQKAGSLIICFVTETPDSPVIKTNYCKQVQ